VMYTKESFRTERGTVRAYIAGQMAARTKASSRGAHHRTSRAFDAPQANGCR
jgi:hypothetical protein